MGKLLVVSMPSTCTSKRYAYTKVSIAIRMSRGGERGQLLDITGQIRMLENANNSLE